MVLVTDELRVHLHYTMRGSYPLRMVDVLFCTERAYFVEYDYLTPVDLLFGSPDQRAAAFASRVVEEGVHAALETAETVETQSYDTLDKIEVHSGGRVGRPKITAHSHAGSATTVRVHGQFDAEPFTQALRSTVDGHDVTVRQRDGIGF
ncbi:hypothetical protein HISP_19540 (plasmid) [Haloarcula hispanica N601]|uniref:Uncharacterized protein n=1 Tax=Haloarcula hispanica N601 TaxID=1417673 RepID=V5TTJ0_HALHI|nr:hypothetical protein HISP_19540 [Haloarcula hispanica N601]MUV49425.1 hypothetical protein [Haloarcula sp. CBA1122]